MDDLLADFIEETRELLEASEGEIIAWEADPADRARLDTIFRFVHTVKGNCGFFDLPRLEQLSHAAEDALADVRSGQREPDSALVTAVLAIIDRISQMVDALDAGAAFPAGGDAELIAALGTGVGQAVPQADGAPSDDLSVFDGPETGVTSSATGASTAPRSIRLPVELLDRVMSGVSDMVLARNDLAHRLREAGTQPSIDGPFERLTTILADVRDAVTRMRMQRIDHLFSGFPRLVRDLSNELGKQVIIDLDGGDVELDREMIEMIRDPMTHIIRNAIDHGIEPPAERARTGKREAGHISIAARQSGNTISIVISDDGKGLDEERIAAKAVTNGLVSEAQLKQMAREEILQLVFAPGLSTAEHVSSVSGRGVGLDVVRANLEKVGGSIGVSSSAGRGSVFTLQIPLTLSIIAGITVEAAGQYFAIPQGFVEEIVHSDPARDCWTSLGDTMLVSFRGQRTPCLVLADVLGLESRELAPAHVLVMLKLARGNLFALAVDAIHTHGDLVVKPLAPAVMQSRIFAGSTLLENGRPILMLDIPNIAEHFGLVPDASEDLVRPQLNEDQPLLPSLVHQAMLFRTFDGVRRAVRLELVRRIETVPACAIDRSGASLRAVVEGEILPLVGMAADTRTGDVVRMLRLSDGSCELLYAASAVEDAVSLMNELVPVADEPLIEAVTLVGDETVAVIDGHALFASYGKRQQGAARLTCHLPDNEWAHTILAPLVKAAGYCPTDDAGSADIAILIDAHDAPSGPGAVIRLRSLPDHLVPAGDVTSSIYRYDRDAVLGALRAIGAGATA